LDADEIGSNETSLVQLLFCSSTAPVLGAENDAKTWTAVTTIADAAFSERLALRAGCFAYHHGVGGVICTSRKGHWRLSVAA
jgi:hypothetical protein